jgi:DNA invertase Pin-like site-specific DNA recombinase
MHIANWGARVSDAEAYRRAGARRNFNERRQERARQRRAVVEQAWLTSGGRRGWQAAIARALHMHRATITRDLKAIKAAWGF